MDSKIIFITFFMLPQTCSQQVMKFFPHGVAAMFNKMLVKLLSQYLKVNGKLTLAAINSVGLAEWAREF